MADKIDKSLDELIKQNKGTKGASSGFRGRRAGTGPARANAGLARAGAGAGVGGGMRRPNRSVSNFPMRRNGPGGIQKRRSAGNIGLSPNKAIAASMNGQWSHDLYQNGQGNNKFKRNSIGQIGTAKLVISNLDFGVNDADIKGLFQEFGILKKAAVHYDRSGRSLGTADVVFERKSDAVKAMSHYNGVCLDGRPMNIQLTATASSLVKPQTNEPNRMRKSAGGTPRGGGGGGGGARRNNNQRVQKSAADLDAELDAHNAKMQTD